MREISDQELAYLRSPGQHSKLYLAVPEPAVIFKAHVNQSDIGTDIVVSVKYSNVDYGSHTDVLPGMTLLVGTLEGGCDLGIGRIRKDPTDSVLYIGRTSEINFSDGVHLTVIEDFGIWARHPFIQSSGDHLLFQDQDIPYGDQHTDLDPVPILGPDFVLWYKGVLGGDNVVVAMPDASDSYCLGSTVTGYVWSAPGASSTSGMSTATPTLVYNATGTYRISCTITAGNTKTFTGHRKVVVFDDDKLPISSFNLKSCSGEYTTGGWRYVVEMFDEADINTIRDRSQVILFSIDWYGDFEISVGQILGRENIIVNGWVSENDISYNIKGGSCELTIHNARYWLESTEGFILGVENKPSGADATAWTNMKNLTFYKGLWHFLHWRSTATAVIDIYLNGTSWLCPAIEAPSGSLWTQIQTVAAARMMAHCAVDRYNRLFVEIESQYVSHTERNFVNVMTIEAYDRLTDITVERKGTAQTSLLNISGVAYDGADGTSLFALANGHIFKRSGKSEVIDGLSCNDQDQIIELAGLILARRNNKYPRLEVELASNNRMFDICPNQTLTVVIDPNECPRGVIISGIIFPRSITYTWNPKTNSFTVKVTGETEVAEIELSVKGDIPSNPDDPDDPLPPPFEFPEIPPLPDGGIDIPTSRGAEYMMGKTWMSDTINHLGYLQFMKFADPFLHTNNKGLFLTYYNSNYIYIRRRCKGTLTVEFVAHHPSGTSIGGYTIFQAFPDDIFEGMANIYGNYEYSKQHLGENANSRCIVICSFDGFGTFNFSAANYSGGPLQYLSNYWITEV